MLSFFHRTKTLAGSHLFNDQRFYPAFKKDLSRCKREVIIESPFLTVRRINSLLPVMKRLHQRGARIIINITSASKRKRVQCHAIGNC